MASEASDDPPNAVWVVILPGGSDAKVGDAVSVPDYARCSAGYAVVPDSAGFPMVCCRVAAEEVQAVRSSSGSALQREFH